MITILHGDNIEASRKELNRIKSAFKGEIINLDGKVLTATDFIQATQSESLFGENKLVVIENLLTNKKKAAFSLTKAAADVVFWEDKALSKTVLEEFKSLKVQEFKIDPVIFKLVDSLLPGNGPKSVALLRECRKNEEGEYIFLMIVRQFRLMLNPAGLSPWQATKIDRQRKAFGSEKLKKTYSRLLLLDYQNKTGQLPADFICVLELFLLTL